MENAPVITINGLSRYPGADGDDWERYIKWNQEVYAPLIMKYPTRKGCNTFQIIRDTPLFPPLVFFNHHETLESQQQAIQDRDMVSVWEDALTWEKRNVMTMIWSAVFQLAKSFRYDKGQAEDLDTRITNAPIMHMEGYKLSAEDMGKYDKWFNEYGANIFVPLFMKQLEVKGYDFYKFTGTQVRNPREKEYPDCLLLIYFENIQAFEKYERSPELTTFQKTMRSVFPLGLNYKWYVQYKLTYSLTK